MNLICPSHQTFVVRPLLVEFPHLLKTIYKSIIESPLAPDTKFFVYSTRKRRASDQASRILEPSHCFFWTKKVILTFRVWKKTSKLLLRQAFGCMECEGLQFELVPQHSQMKSLRYHTHPTHPHITPHITHIASLPLYLVDLQNKIPQISHCARRIGWVTSTTHISPRVYTQSKLIRIVEQILCRVAC